MLPLARPLTDLIGLSEYASDALRISDKLIPLGVSFPVPEPDLDPVSQEEPTIESLRSIVPVTDRVIPIVTVPVGKAESDSNADHDTDGDPDPLPLLLADAKPLAEKDAEAEEDRDPLLGVLPPVDDKHRVTLKVPVFE